MTAYYNEFDPFAAQWLRQLISAGHIAPGDVDERSIEDVRPDDLRPYTQCHFFAGIGGWSYALRLAGWPDDRPVWTGSCPCQPFSSAGRQKGKADDRHLWPVWFRLIQECRPATVFGEQVASAIAHGWLDDVYQGLEAEGYAVGSAVLPAYGVGAPHKRDRLWFVANAEGERSGGAVRSSGETLGRSTPGNGLQFGGTGDSSGTLADSEGTKRKQPENSWARRDGFTGHDSDVADTTEFRCVEQRIPKAAEVQRECAKREGEYERPEHFGQLSGGFERLGGVSGDVGQPISTRSQGHPWYEQGRDQSGRITSVEERSAWTTGVWIDCPDGKQRLIEPGIPLLANGVSNRVGKLRGYGNAIVPQVAAQVISAYMEKEL